MSGNNLENQYKSLDQLAQDFPRYYRTLLIDPPWQFQNRTGKMAPEHRRLSRYNTMTLSDLKSLPINDLMNDKSHVYLWCPNALLEEGLGLLKAWGFQYKTNLVWYKVRKDGGPDRRGVGFYFRNVTELILFGVRGKQRTFSPARRQENMIIQRKREHSKKPYELYNVIEDCSPPPRLELFARERRSGWDSWGDEVDTYEENRPRNPSYHWDPKLPV